MPEQKSDRSAAERAARRQELDALRQRVQALEAELEDAPATPTWQAQGFYGAYYATTGFMLGLFGAGASLLANVVGSLFWGPLTGQANLHPLHLIQVYLTFPLGEQALSMNSGLLLSIGVCLYLATGMLYGILFQLVLTRYTADAGFGTRLFVASLLGLAVWIVNFYGILSWLQPLLFGGSWIADMIPAWVGAGTHLVYGWTMALVYPLGLYHPYRVETNDL